MVFQIRIGQSRGTEGVPKHAAIKRSIVRHNGFLVKKLLQLRPLFPKSGLVPGVAVINAVQRRIEGVVIIGLWFHQEVIGSQQLAIFHHRNPQGANAAALAVGGFEVNGDEVHGHKNRIFPTISMENSPYLCPMQRQDLISNWKFISLTEYDRLRAAREQVHQAVQLVAGMGRSYLPTIKDESFANLDFLPESGMIAGRIVGGRWQFRVAIQPATLTLHLLNPQNRPLSHFNLHGKTFQEAIFWLKAELKGLDVDSEQYTPEAPYSIPEYPTATGTPFDSSDQEAFTQLADYFHNAFLFLTYVGHLHVLALPIKIWPHHFDIATRRRFTTPEGPWHMGIAFSTGDDFNYPIPNFHLTRYPKEPANQGPLPELEPGLNWHNNDRWLGIVLKADFFAEVPTAEAQAERALKLIEQGMPALAGL